MSTVRPRLTLGLEAPRFSVCGCCGGRTTSLVRFVFRDGAPYAVYYAALSENHTAAGVRAVVSRGDWSAEGSPERRSAFALRLSASPAGFHVELVDGEDSPWRTATLIGRLLGRDEALVDPLLPEVLRIANEIAAQDPEVRAFLGLQGPNASAIPEA